MKVVLSIGARVVMCLTLFAVGCPQLLADDFTVVPASDAGVDCAFQACGDACVDLRSNPSHCGACGDAIGKDQICSMGNAVAAEVGCGTRTLCNGGCVDTKSHPLFCGACDVECKRGAHCMMGNCMCAPPAAKDCGDACRECCADADCPMDKLCSNGLCELHCSEDQTICGNRCVDLATDPKNCGECRKACGPGGVCAASVCG